jgi:hypothetical protein
MTMAATFFGDDFYILCKPAGWQWLKQQQPKSPPSGQQG